MKKIILSLMILLGGIAGAQAQTFDFSCNDDSFTESTWLPLSEGLTNIEIGSLQTDGYTISTDTNGNERLSQEFENPTYQFPNGGGSYNFNGDVTFSVQVGMFYDGRDDSAPDLGPFNYRIRNARGFGSIDFLNNVEDVLYLLLPNRFTPAEFVILNASAFSNNDNHNVATDGDIWNIRKFENTYNLHDDDGDFDEYYATLVLAIAAYTAF